MSGARRPPWSVTAAALVLTCLVGAGVAAPWLAPYDPRALAGAPFEPPGRSHWLGTNDIGQDLLSELLHGARRSLAVGLAAAVVAVAIGGIAGILAGYRGGWTDTIVAGLIDVALVLPLLPLAVLIAAYVGAGMWHLVLLIGGLSWARVARLIRSQVQTIAGSDYVTACRALGATQRRVVTFCLLPAVWPLVVAQFALITGHAVALESSLSFLGLGDPTHKSWGTMLYYAQARSAFQTGHWPWWVLPPTLSIALTVSSLALVGFAMTDRSGTSMTK